MKSIGQLALRTLMSSHPLLQRSEVLKIVGDFAFDYGLFAGHEDIRLCGDPTADIYVTYPHRSLEEFFGSYGFIQALDEGQSIDDILRPDCQEPIFMVNPLVLRFCLWFLSSSDFDFLRKGECYDKLTSYVAKRIDSKVLDPVEVRRRYPAIDMLFPPAPLGYSIFQFFHDILNKCKDVTTLHVHNSQLISLYLKDVDQFFGLMEKDFIGRMTKIIIGRDTFELKDIDSNSLKLSIDVHYEDALQVMHLLLQKYGLSDRNPQTYMHICTGASSDMTYLLSKYSKELHIDDDHNALPLLKSSGEFPHCPKLTHLTFQGVQIDDSVPLALRRAIQSGKLPCLTCVTLIRCIGSLYLPPRSNVKVSVYKK